ncbi:hypothetical protein OIDMADRAFT_29233 [Oidiodendron maius Zn]|uniref:Uncharacterized protein n=1 Tax=Oidiodendron maius (strain Zn) TaxID=913774 RepID=A0A0C3HA66_OIDMZ|nr:hypothetical protein OIDMADRAFT_29233 [Oidiodendron maius Zn]
MAPILNSSGLQPIHIAIAIISAIIFIAILPFVIAIFWIIATDIWAVMFKDRSRHLKLEKLRKQWNKAGQAERQRQQAVNCLVRDMVERERVSEEKWFLFLELTEMSYFPARRYIYHPIIRIFRNRFWDRVIYQIFKRGYYTHPRQVDINEWNKAMARARGEIDIHLEEYARAFPLIPPPYSLVMESAIE